MIKAYILYNKDVDSTNASVKDLPQRTELILKGFQKMVNNGFLPKNFSIIEKNSPYQQRDLVRVYLGIKPAATHLFSIMPIYKSMDRNAGYLRYIMEAIDIDIKIDPLTFTVWNPNLAYKLIQLNKDLLDNTLVNPNDMSHFGSFLLQLHDSRKRNERILYGVLMGYPRKAVESFVLYNAKAFRAAQAIWLTAEKKSIKLRTKPPQDFAIDLHEKGGLDEQIKIKEFIRLAKLVGYSNQKVINYVKGLRTANIPGWKFFVSGDETLDEENEINNLYVASEFEIKYKKFLKEIEN